MTQLSEERKTALFKWLRARKSRWLPEGSVRNRLAEGAWWTFAGTAFSNLFGLATGVLTARIVGQVSFGELGILVSTFALFSQLGCVGLGDTATKHLAEFRVSDPTRAGRIAGAAMTTACISYATMAVVLAASATPIAVSFLNAPSLAPLLRWSSLYLLASGIYGIQAGILAGLEDFRALARLNALRAVLNLPLTIAGALLFGLEGVVGVMVLMAATMAVVSRLAVRRAAAQWSVPLCYRLDWSHAAVFWRFSLPSFLAGNLVVPASWAANALLVHQTNGYAEMGLLNAAHQWRAVAVLIPGIASSVLLPIHSNLFSEGRYRQYRRSIIGNIALQAAVSTVVVGVLVLGAGSVMSAYGHGFATGASVLVWLSFSWWFGAPIGVLWGAMVASNRVWTGLFFNGIGASTLLTLAWMWGVQGAKGIAMAYCVSSAVQLLVQGWYFATLKEPPSPNGPPRPPRDA
jgi:O-antigen/teichoic acid export membrane protein